MKNSVSDELQYSFYQQQILYMTQEINNELTLYTANIELFFYESPEAIIQSIYNLDEIIGLERGLLFIDEDDGLVISSLGVVSLFAGTIVVFSH